MKIEDDFEIKLQSSINFAIKKCEKHNEQNLTTICSEPVCPLRGPVCPICLVEDHSSHLEKSGDLELYIY